MIVKTLMSTFITLFSSALDTNYISQAISLGILKISWNIHSVLHHHIRSFNKNFDSVVKWLTLMRVGFLGVHFEVMGGFIFPITVNSLLWIDRNCKNGNDVTIFRHDVIVNFLDVVLFLLSSLVTDPSFMAISSLVLEFWQFLFVRDCPEIWKLEIPLSEFCPISGDWGE